MGAAASATSTLAEVTSEAIEDYCYEITGHDYTHVFSKHNVDGKVLESYIGNVDTLIDFLSDIGMTDLDHQQMLYDTLMQMVCSHNNIIMEDDVYLCESCRMRMTLMIAALNGHSECISHMIECQQADLTKRNVDGTTALHLAVSSGHTDSLKVLLAYDQLAETKKQVIDYQDKDGWTAAMIAAAGDMVPCLTTLLTHNANLDIVNEDGRNALLLAAVAGQEKAVDSILRHVASAETAVSVQDMEGMTPLMLAAAGGHFACVQRLIAAGSNVQAANEEGTTPVMLASLNGHTRCLKYLLENGAGLTTNIDGTTSLMLAASCGHIECISLLLSHGADVTDQNNEGVSALMFATENGHVECEKVLSQHASSGNKS